MTDPAVRHPAVGGRKMLALDLGTSSVRGLVLDEHGAPVPGAFARRRTKVTTGRDGTGTLDAPTYLIKVGECLDELAEAGHLHGVGVVATAAQWHSVVPLDGSGAPLGPVLTWLDTRPGPLPDAPGPGDAHDFHQRTGTWWHRLYWTVRLPWLRSQMDTGPALFTDIGGYVYRALLTDAPMSVSQASGTGMLNLHTGGWDAEATELAGVNGTQLPALAEPGWHGRLRPEYARRWPDLRGAEWAAPTGDGAAANIGINAIDPTRVAVTVGTSTAVRLTQTAPVGAPHPPLPDELWRYRVDHERVVTGTAYSGGGNLFGWARRELRLPSPVDLDAALATVVPGVGVTADPRLGGDRPPGVAPSGSGQLTGLSFGTTAVEMFAALMYGVCRQVAEGLAIIEAAAGRELPVTLSGGAIARSFWWRQAFVKALAPRDVHYVVHPEISAIGAAVLAVGLPDLPIVLERIEPLALGARPPGHT
jgi:gluconokinase